MFSNIFVNFQNFYKYWEIQLTNTKQHCKGSLMLKIAKRPWKPSLGNDGFNWPCWNYPIERAQSSASQGQQATLQISHHCWLTLTASSAPWITDCYPQHEDSPLSFPPKLPQPIEQKTSIWTLRIWDWHHYRYNYLWDYPRLSRQHPVTNVLIREVPNRRAMGRLIGNGIKGWSEEGQKKKMGVEDLKHKRQEELPYRTFKFLLL